MRLLLRLTVFLLLASVARAQSSCPPLAAPAIDPARLLFSPQQEQELGVFTDDQTAFFLDTTE